MSDHLGIGHRLELLPFLFALLQAQLTLQVFEVRDEAIVEEGDLLFGVLDRMRVLVKDGTLA